METNQAVIFTKPLHHLGIDLTPKQLDQAVRSFFTEKGFGFLLSRPLTGADLAARDAIKEHYLMYSRAACADTVEITTAGKEKFEAAFGKTWDDEMAAGHIMTTKRLLAEKGLDVHGLFDRWNRQFTARKTAKLQDGMIMAWMNDLEAYCINAFYPAMEANFYNPLTQIDYHVVEFDPAQVSWERFRRNVLGSTDASKADPDSFRGQLYAEYKVDFPGRDNFVHGSAGPLEGFVERVIHEPDFLMPDNPVGRYLAGKGVTIESFKKWKAGQSLSAIGELFDATEEKDTGEVLAILEGVSFATSG